MVGPAMTMAEKKPWAMACSLFGKVSKRIDCALAMSPPPPSPCMTRATMRSGRLVATPQRTEAMVKAMSEKTK